MANLTFILGGGLLSLGGLGAAGIMLLNEQNQKKAWVARREEAMGGYLKPKSSGGPALVVAVRSKSRGSTNSNPIFTLFGWNEARREHYPMSLPATVLCMLGPASIAALLLWFFLLRRGTASSASSLHFLMPPLGLLMSWAALGEALNPLDLLGVIPVAIGIRLATTEKTG